MQGCDEEVLYVYVVKCLGENLTTTPLFSAVDSRGTSVLLFPFFSSSGVSDGTYKDGRAFQCLAKEGKKGREKEGIATRQPFFLCLNMPRHIWPIKKWTD